MWLLYWILQQNWKKKLELLLHVGNALIPYFEIYCMIHSHEKEKEKKIDDHDLFNYWHFCTFSHWKLYTSKTLNLLPLFIQSHHRTFVFFPIDLNLASGMTGLKRNAIGSLGWRLYMPIGWENIQGYTWSDDNHSPSKPSLPSHLTSKTLGIWCCGGFLNALRVHWECNNVGDINWDNWATKV
jgi:hypothetical protein